MTFDIKKSSFPLYIFLLKLEALYSYLTLISFSSLNVSLNLLIKYNNWLNSYTVNS